jgi:hypothetical protein
VAVMQELQGSSSGGRLVPGNKRTGMLAVQLLSMMHVGLLLEKVCSV